jgi:AcrR family transcriptional regulator
LALNQEGHLTRQQLLDVTVEMLAEVSHEDLTMAIVLEKANVSKSSLYHFFEDFKDLLGEALLERFRRSVLTDVTKEAARNSKSQEDYFIALDKITTLVQSRGRATIRFERAQILGRARTDEKFRLALGIIQQELTDALTEAFAVAQDKGFLTTTIEPRTIAVFVQSYTLGKVVDDLTQDQMNDKDWNRLIGQIFRRTLGASG